MTPEEAIKELQERVDIWWKEYRSHSDEQIKRYIQALVMGIKALEKTRVFEWEVEENPWYSPMYTCPACRDAFTIIEGTPDNNNLYHCPNCGQRLVYIEPAEEVEEDDE